MPILYLFFIIGTCVMIGITPSPEQHPEANMDVITAEMAAWPPVEVVVITDLGPQESVVLDEATQELLERKSWFEVQLDDFLATLPEGSGYAVAVEPETQSILVRRRDSQNVVIIHTITMEQWNTEKGAKEVLENAKARIEERIKKPKKSQG